MLPEWHVRKLLLNRTKLLTVLRSGIQFKVKVVVPFTSNNDDFNSPIFLGYNINQSHYVFLQPKAKETISSSDIPYQATSMTTDDWDDSPAVDDNVSEISTNSATLDRCDFMSRSDDERSSCYDIGLLANGDAMTDDTRRQLLAGPSKFKVKHSLILHNAH